MPDIIDQINSGQTSQIPVHNNVQESIGTSGDIIDRINGNPYSASQDVMDIAKQGNYGLGSGPDTALYPEHRHLFEGGILSDIFDILGTGHRLIGGLLAPHLLDNEHRSFYDIFTDPTFNWRDEIIRSNPDLLKSAGGRALARGTGLFADIALDPLSYAIGPVTKAAKGLEATSQLGNVVGKSIRTIIDPIGLAGEAGASLIRMNPATAQLMDIIGRNRAIDKQLYELMDNSTIYEGLSNRESKALAEGIRKQAIQEGTQLADSAGLTGWARRRAIFENASQYSRDFTQKLIDNPADALSIFNVEQSAIDDTLKSQVQRAATVADNQYEKYWQKGMAWGQAAERAENSLGRTQGLLDSVRQKLDEHKIQAGQLQDDLEGWRASNLAVASNENSRNVSKLKNLISRYSSHRDELVTIDGRINEIKDTLQPQRQAMIDKLNENAARLDSGELNKITLKEANDPIFAEYESNAAELEKEWKSLQVKRLRLTDSMSKFGDEIDNLKGLDLDVERRDLNDIRDRLAGLHYHTMQIAAGRAKETTLDAAVRRLDQDYQFFSKQYQRFGGEALEQYSLAEQQRQAYKLLSDRAYVRAGLGVINEDGSKIARQVWQQGLQELEDKGYDPVAATELWDKVAAKEKQLSQDMVQARLIDQLTADKWAGYHLRRIYNKFENPEDFIEFLRTKSPADAVDLESKMAVKGGRIGNAKVNKQRLIRVTDEEYAKLSKPISEAAPPSSNKVRMYSYEGGGGYYTPLKDEANQLSNGAKILYVDVPKNHAILNGIDVDSILSNNTRGQGTILTQDLLDNAKDLYKTKNVNMQGYISDSMAKDLGEIMEAGPRIIRGESLQARAIAKSNFMSDVADHFGLTKEQFNALDPSEQRMYRHLDGKELPRVGDEIMSFGKPTGEYYTEETLPKPTTKWGKAQGLYVPKRVFDQLQYHYSDVPTGAYGVWQRLVTGWKWGKTVGNPAAHVRNVMANYLRAWHEAGMDPFTFTKYMGRAYAGIKKESPEWIEALNNGAVFHDASTFMGAEFQKALKEFRTELGFMGNIKRGWNFVSKPLGDLYQMEEQVGKFAAYLYGVDRGMAPREAAELAERTLFNYSKVSPLVGKLRRGWVPFITYPSKAIPAELRNIAENPGRYTWERHIYEAISGLDATPPNERQHERNTLPDYINPDLALRLPFKDSTGRTPYFDLQYIAPFGQMEIPTQGPTGGNPIVNAGVSMANPILRLAFEIGSNVNAHTGQPITGEIDQSARDIDYAKYAFQQLPPPELPLPMGLSGYSAQRIIDAKRGVTDAQGNPQSLPQAIAASVGFKTTPISIDQNELRIAHKIDLINKTADELIQTKMQDNVKGKLTDDELDREIERILASREAQIDHEANKL